MGMFNKDVGEDADFDVLTNEVELARPAVLGSYLDNLQRLGLITISHSQFEPPPPDPQSRMEDQERRRSVLAYLRHYGVEQASQARELFISKSRTVLWKNLTGNRAWMDVRLILPTDFGSQLLRTTTEPNEVATLSRITDDEIAAEAEEEKTIGQ